MCGAILPLLQYTFMAWCSVEAQEQHCLTVLETDYFIGRSFDSQM